MATYKVAELEGHKLDLAVGKADGINLYYRPAVEIPPYSTVWEHGGPIIERESLAVFRQEWSDRSLREWRAGSSHDLDEGPKSSGPTPLIAAMRAYVASKFGETVELS
jgi:hypothetical protein